MQKTLLTSLTALGIVLLIATLTVAQQPEAPKADVAKPAVAGETAGTDVKSLKQRHPWGRFEPGAWSLVRVVNETFDEKGDLVSTGMTETFTTLVKVEDDGVTLQFETSAWVSGKRLDAKPQIVKQCFHGGLCGDNVKVSHLPPVKIKIDGIEIECKVEEASLVDGNLRNVIHTYYNDTVSPFVFKRESDTINVEKQTVVSQTIVQVDALDMPCEVLEDIHSASHYRIVREQSSGARAITLAYMSPEIPGGTIRHSAKEMDINGRVVSRSILELTDFGTQPEEKRIRIFNRRIRPAKYQRNMTRSVECLTE